MFCNLDKYLWLLLNFCVQGLVVRPVAEGWSGELVQGRGAALTATIAPVNDAPVVAAGEPANLPLVPFDIEQNIGMEASELAGRTILLTTDS